MKPVPVAVQAGRVYTTRYEKFRGVDFSTDPSLVSESRSPYAPNMISDAGGMPQKRVGWRRLHKIDSPVNGLYGGIVGKERRLLAHGGQKLYLWSETQGPVLLYEGLSNSRSRAFSMGGKLWILTGREYLVYDGERVRPVRENAYVPVTTIARSPAGGGASYEGVNLLSPWRKNYFLADGAATVYQLDAAGLDGDKVTAVVNGEAMEEGKGFAVNRTLGRITFDAAPKKPEDAGGVKGADNVLVTFAKTVPGYRERIEGCTIFVQYGAGTSDRVFFSGNPAYRNWDWYSGLSDPSYVSDLSYSAVGSEDTAVMGYRRIGSQLAVIKEDNGEDSTIFLRSAESSGGAVSFPLRQGVAGIGAVSKYAFANLIDEPLFLSGTGVYAITSNVITAERTVQNRSWYVDARLTKEPGLASAVAEEWNGCYLLAVNGGAYLLDGKQQKSYKPQSGGDYLYECYRWEDFPAVCLFNCKEEGGENLYFGAGDGSICRLNDDMERLDRFNDYPEGLSGPPRAVKWAWATKADDDGDISVLKTMQKRGCLAIMKPYIQGSAEVCFRTDRDAVERRVRYDTIDIFDWEYIDFARGISFDSNDAPRTVFFQKRVKNYKTLQIIIRGEALSEGAGIYGIVKHYTRGGYAKR